MPIDPLSMLLGPVISLIGHGAKQKAAQQKRQSDAITAKYSPWTGVSAGGAADPSMASSLLQGGIAGFLMGKGSDAPAGAGGVNPSELVEKIKSLRAPTEDIQAPKMMAAAPQQGNQYSLGADTSLGMKQLPAWMRMV